MAFQNPFKRNNLDFGGAFAADKGILWMPALSADTEFAPVLVQNLSWNYAQQVTRLYELGEWGRTNRFYYVGGRAQGNMGINRIIGPGTLLAQFYDKFGDPCNALNNTAVFSVTPSCDTDLFDGAYRATNLLMANIGGQVGAQDLLIGESSQLMFNNLLYQGA
jgi:hypothetical protein